MIIDFEGEAKTLTVKFSHSERLIIKNGVKGSALDLGGKRVISKAPALIIDCEQMNMRNGTIVGGLQVAGDIDVLYLQNLSVLYGEHGLHMTQHTKKETYGRIFIWDCEFKYMLWEGIYIGDHTAVAPKIDYIEILNTKASHCGWDGCQVGNTKNVNIKGCKFTKNAKLRAWGQNFNLTINPGCGSASIENTEYTDSAKFLSPKTFVY